MENMYETDSCKIFLNADYGRRHTSRSGKFPCKLYLKAKLQSFLRFFGFADNEVQTKNARTFIQSAIFAHRPLTTEQKKEVQQLVDQYGQDWLIELLDNQDGKEPQDQAQNLGLTLEAA